MVDLGQVVATKYEGSIAANSSETITPFGADKKVLVVTAHVNEVSLRSISLAYKQNGNVYPVLEGSGVSVACTTGGNLTITNNTSKTLQYLVV